MMSMPVSSMSSGLVMRSSARPPRNIRGKISLKRSLTGVERLLEEPSRLAVHLLDGAREVGQGLLEVGLLRRVEREALLGLGVLAHRVEVHAAHALDEPRELVDARARARRRAAGACGSRRRRAAGAARGTCRPRRRAGARARAASRAAPSRGSRAPREPASTRARRSLSAPSRSSSPPRSCSNSAAHARERVLRVARAVERAAAAPRGAPRAAPPSRRRRARWHEHLVVEPSGALAQLLGAPREARLGPARRGELLARARRSRPCTPSPPGAARRAARAPRRARPRPRPARACALSTRALRLARARARRLVALEARLLDARAPARRPRRASASRRRTTLSSCPSAFCRSFSAVTSASSRGAPRAAPCRAPRPSARSRRATPAAPASRLVDREVEPLDRLGQLARLALAVDHPGRDLVALPARDAAVGVQHGAVERHERRARRPPRAGARALAAVAHDDGVADERAHERLVLRREAQRVGQAAATPSSSAGSDGLRAGDERRRAAARWSRAPFALARAASSSSAPRSTSLHDDVLQPRARAAPRAPASAPRAPRRGRPRGPRCTRRASRRAPCVPAPDALEPRVHLLERVAARALLRELALGLVERALLRLDELLQLAQPRPRGAPSRPRVVTRPARRSSMRPRELLGARRVLDPRELERLALERAPSRGAPPSPPGAARSPRASPRRSRSRPARVAIACRRSVDARVGRAVRAARTRRASPPRSAMRVRLRASSSAQRRHLARRRRRARPRGARRARPSRASRPRPAARAARAPPGGPWRARSRPPPRAPRSPPRSSRSVAASSVSSAACTSRRDASSSASRAASSVRASLARLREPLDLAALELHPADELEVPVRRLVELQVLELVAVGDEALGLRGLALERREVPVDLGDDVAHAQQVLLRELHLLLCLLLAALELRDARRPPR